MVVVFILAVTAGEFPSFRCHHGFHSVLVSYPTVGSCRKGTIAGQAGIEMSPAFARPVAEPPLEYSGIVRSRKFGARCPNDPIRLDSWRCLGRNANGGLLIHAVDKSPEIGAAVIDDDIEGSARPWLILDAVDEALMQHAVAFNPIRFVVGRGG